MKKFIRIWSIFFTILFVIQSCKEQVKIKEITVGQLSFSVPESTVFLKRQGTDSYVGYLILNKKDTFHIEYGDKKRIYDLFQLPPKAVPFSDKEGLLKHFGKLPPTDEVVFSNFSEKDNLQNVFDKNYYSYDTLNGIIAKIIQPKKIGKGMTGCYIPDLKDGNSFSIYSEDLASASRLLGLQIFRTIKYK